MFDHCIYFNTVSLGRQLERAWSEAFKPFSLTPPQAFTLRAVLEKPGMLQSELADTLKIARATATRAVDGLEARGFVERRQTKRDGRECEIHPTSEAIELRDALNAASAAMTERFKGSLGADHFRDFVEQVKDVSNRIS